MLQAPDTGPHPAKEDPEIDPIVYPHERVILATPKAFDTTAVKDIPAPDALLQATVLSDTHICCLQEVPGRVNCPSRIEGVAEFNAWPLPFISIVADPLWGMLM